jgi:hypothetical protein
VRLGVSIAISVAVATSIAIISIPIAAVVAALACCAGLSAKGSKDILQEASLRATRRGEGEEHDRLNGDGELHFPVVEVRDRGARVSVYGQLKDAWSTNNVPKIPSALLRLRPRRSL